jgi:hypothetical protein
VARSSGQGRDGRNSWGGLPATDDGDRGRAGGRHIPEVGVGAALSGVSKPNRWARAG